MGVSMRRRFEWTWAAAWLAIGFASGLRAAPPDHRLLEIEPTHRVLGIRPSADRTKIALTATGEVRPIGYRFSTNVTTSAKQWRNVNVTPGVTNGPVEINAPPVQTFYAASYPDFKAKNGYLRIPAGMNTQEPHTLTVFLHGDTPEALAGPYLESFIGDWFDDYDALSWFPTSLANSPNNAAWAVTSATGADHAYLEHGILACKRLANINRVVIVGYSAGAAEAVALTQLLSQTRPGLVNAIVVFAPTYNDAMAQYLKKLKAAPILFDPPIECVTISSSGDNFGLDGVAIIIAREMARANGYTAAPVELPGLVDVNELPGDDTKVYTFGPWVRRLQIVGSPPKHPAPDHDGSQFVSDPGADRIYRDGIVLGKWPGGQ